MRRTIPRRVFSSCRVATGRRRVGRPAALNADRGGPRLTTLAWRRRPQWVHGRERHRKPPPPLDHAGGVPPAEAHGDQYGGAHHRAPLDRARHLVVLHHGTAASLSTGASSASSDPQSHSTISRVHAGTTTSGTYSVPITRRSQTTARSKMNSRRSPPKSRPR